MRVQTPLHRLIGAVSGASNRARRPVVVGLDGRSGAGKSTLSADLAQAWSADPTLPGRVSVIDGDDFYAGGSAAAWDRRTAAEKADQVIDWRRQRDVLERLRQTGVSSWRPFDWNAPDWDAEPAPLATEPISATLGAIAILEGAYSCRPELHDLLDLRVLLRAPDDLRDRRLRARDGGSYRSDWNGRWAQAEEFYFGTVMPPQRFDLVLDAADERPRE